MTKRANADQGLLRNLNTAVLLDELRRFEPLSRAELSSRTGLNRSTVSIIVDSLIEENLVQETNLQNSKVGRPGMLLKLNPNGGFAIGIELGVDCISIIVSDFIANVLWREQMCGVPGDDQILILERAISLTQRALDFGQAQGLRPLGIGMGVPGLVDLRQGKLIFAPNLHWNNVPLQLIWLQRFNLPVFIENEAKAAALGEYYFGVAQDVFDFIYLSAGIGLGAGIVIDGKLFRGNNGYAGEIGHITVDPNGEVCGCGKRGCWETQVGPRAVLRRVRNTIETGSPSILSDMVDGDLERITFENVVQAVSRDDSVALHALEEVGEHLGIGVANLVNIFNPELIVLGGELNRASKILLPIVTQIINENVLYPIRENVRVAASAHGTDACTIGAIALVLEDILRIPVSESSQRGFSAYLSRW